MSLYGHRFIIKLHLAGTVDNRAIVKGHYSSNRDHHYTAFQNVFVLNS